MRLADVLAGTEEQIRSHEHETIGHHDTIERLLYYTDQQCHLCSLIIGTAWLDGESSVSDARDRLLSCYGADHPPLELRIYGHKPSKDQGRYTSAPEAGVLCIDSGLGT